MDTLAIVRYLFANGYKNMEPRYVIERNHPAWVTELPSIHDENLGTFIGVKNCYKYFEKVAKITDLQEKVLEWESNNPNYRIGDASK